MWWRTPAFRRHHRPAYPALCGGRVLGFYFVASRHGHALAENSRAALGEECDGEWAGCHGHWHYDRSGSGSKIRRRRVDHVAFYSVDDCVLQAGPPPLSRGEIAYQLQGSGECGWPEPASHRGDCHRPLEQYYLPGNPICCPTFARSDRRRCGTEQPHVLKRAAAEADAPQP